MKKDPVCGMMIEIERAEGKSEYQGEVYYFCTTMCRVLFDADPEKYIPDQSGPSDQLRQQ